MRDISEKVTSKQFVSKVSLIGPWFLFRSDCFELPILVGVQFLKYFMYADVETSLPINFIKKSYESKFISTMALI